MKNLEDIGMNEIGISIRDYSSLENFKPGEVQGFMDDRINPHITYLGMSLSPNEGWEENEVKEALGGRGWEDWSNNPKLWDDSWGDNTL